MKRKGPRKLPATPPAPDPVGWELVGVLLSMLSAPPPKSAVGETRSPADRATTAERAATPTPR